jgi:hypothetical protein
MVRTRNYYVLCRALKGGGPLQKGGYTVRTRNYVANDDQKKQGCQERRPPPVGDATPERSPDTHKVRPQHTQQARNGRINKAMVQMYCSGHSTQVLPRSVDGNIRTL